MNDISVKLDGGNLFWVVSENLNTCVVQFLEWGGMGMDSRFLYVFKDAVELRPHDGIYRPICGHLPGFP